MFTLSVSAAVGFSAPEPKVAAGGNMNGAYVVSSGGKVGVPFNTDYASKGHEYFDVWAPEIATHYGEARPLELLARPHPPTATPLLSRP